MFCPLLVVALAFCGVDLTIAANNDTSNSTDLPHYRVVAVADGVVIQNNTDDPTHPFNGPFIGLLETMANTLNFTYNITAQPDHEYGNNKGPGGKWNGMMGSLVDDVADLAVGSFIGTPECGQVATFARIPYNLTAELLINPEFGTKDVQYLVDSNLDLYILSKSLDPRAREIWQNIKANNLNSSVVSPEEGAKMVAEGKYAYIDHADKIDGLIANSTVKLAKSPEKIETGVSFAPFAVKKGSAKGEALLENISGFLELTGSLLQLTELFADVSNLLEEATSELEM